MNGIIKETQGNQIHEGGVVIGEFTSLSPWGCCWLKNHPTQLFKSVRSIIFIHHHLVELNGLFIDNEYRQDDEKGAEYFVDLLAAYRDNNITVPLTYNDPGARRNFINGTVGVPRPEPPLRSSRRYRADYIHHVAIGCCRSLWVRRVLSTTLSFTA